MSTLSSQTSSEIPNRLGRAIQVRRAILQMQRRDLAEAAELSYPYICELEKGSKEPSARSLRQLASALKFGSTSELLNWVDQVELEPSDDGSAPAPAAGPSVSALQTWADLATTASPRLARSRPPMVAGDDLDAILDRAVQRITDRVMDLLAREIPRLVEQEVARRISEPPTGR